jgi:heme a synthase
MERKIAIWLYVCAFMVFAMAVIGAVTRLTESGLSITEWNPVSGALPPLNAAQWQHEYDLYRQSPEFKDKHFWMALADFKHIFFWEWLHRLWGRLIGVVYGLPLLWFAVRRQIPRGYGWKFVGLLALGGGQGLLGWWMVESGLVDRPSVSHFRLAAHLALALFIFGCTLWLAFDFTPSPRRGEGGGEGDIESSNPLRFKSPSPNPLPEGRGLRVHGLIALALLAATIVWGAFTAGLHAGLIYNTFPLMNGHLTPPEPVNILTEHSWVQFTHRWLAVTAGLAILSFAWRVRDGALAAMVLVQITLGISTLLSVVWLPLAVLHQAGAIILLALTLRALHRAVHGNQLAIRAGL